MAIKKNKLHQLKESFNEQNGTDKPKTSPENTDIKQNNELETTKKASNFILKGIKLILKTTWGMRIALILLGIILFYFGFFIGNIGKTNLKNKVEDKISDIKALKKILKTKETEIGKLKKQINRLNLQLSDSEQKRRFFLQRNKIRKPLTKALTTWKEHKKQDTLELLYKAINNLKLEAKGSMGISALFYGIITSKLNKATALIEKTCTDFNKQEKTADNEQQDNTDVKPDNKDCYKKVLNIIDTSLQILVSPDSKE